MTMTKNLILLLLLSLPFVITSCNEDDDLSSGNNERKDIALSRSQQEMVNENVKFAFSLFDKVNELETEKPNWIISPLSASIALSMTANGTANNSLNQIKDVLGFNDFQMNEINSYYNTLTKELMAVDNTTRLALANSVWLHNDFQFYDSFVNTTEKMYDAEVRTLDLTDQSSLKVINNWCAKHTNGLIPTIFDELPNNLVFCLMNALYFKGVWKNEFDESDTTDETFTCANGRESKVKMMKQKRRHWYYNNESFALAKFPYGNGAFSMVVLLPNEEITLEESLQKFTADYWTESVNLKEKLLKVSFPRFELEYETSLIEVMETLGIIDIFYSNKADFSQLSSSPLFVGLLKQKAYFKVDEKGAEAAAITAVGGETSLPPVVTVKDDEFNMNRPFAFLIMEESTGTILFMGKVTDL